MQPSIFLKTKAFIIAVLCQLLLLSFSTTIFSQDQQWYILNNKERTNYTDATATISFGGPIGNQFFLKNVTHPNRACNANAKNDLLIIYTDGQHFNSREYSYPYNPDYFYPGVSYQTQTDHNFNTGTRIAEALYMSSKYESDDPPELVRSGNGSISGVTLPAYTPGITTPAKIISANHDVTPSSDITLIINTKQLITQYGNGNYYLRYNKVQSLSGLTAPLANNYFRLQNVFNGNPSFPVNSIAPMGAYPVVKLAQGNDFVYVNLRPDPGLNPYYPNNATGTADYRAIFEVVKIQETNPKPQNIATGTIGEVVSFMQEDIRRSHDPNFVRVESICKVDDEYFVYYHAEFQNSSFTAANHLRIEMDFPPDFDEQCIQVSRWSAGGATTTGSVEHVNGLVSFNFHHSASVVACSEKTSLDECIGYIEFCIKVVSSQNLLDAGYNLKPETSVFFGKDKYPLHNFIDLFEEYANKEGIRPLSTSCNCTCPCKGFRCLRQFVWLGLGAIVLAGLILWVYRKRKNLKNPSVVTPIPPRPTGRPTENP